MPGLWDGTEEHRDFRVGLQRQSSLVREFTSVQERPTTRTNLRLRTGMVSAFFQPAFENSS